MGKYLIKAYDKLGNEVGCGYANDEADKEKAKEWLKEKKAKTGLELELEIIKNPDDEDIKPLTDRLTSWAESVKDVENRKALDDICVLYDDREISITEAINRINVLYESEEGREEAIRYLTAPNRGAFNSLYGDPYDDYEDEYEENEDDCEDCCDDTCHCEGGCNEH